ncbi:MAG TPA: hypothetical protein VFU47_08480, partial [Armatimonadota bacterium]|nr:hypothetical protein [Armatimonadota bacterium]
LVLYTAVIAPGPRLQRLAAAVVAGILASAPWFVDRDGVEKWTVAWWPAQPDLLSLFFGLLLLIAAVQYGRTGERRWAVFAPVFFVVAVCFKETAYLAGIGACLVLLRKPARWRVLALLAVLGLALFAFRMWAIGDARAYGDGNDPARVLKWLRIMAEGFAPMLVTVWLPLLCLLSGAGVWLALRRRLGPGPATAAGTGVGLLMAVSLVGSPLEPVVQDAAVALFWLFIKAGVVIGILYSLRSWPLPELWLVWLAALLLARCFVPIYGWHFYWPNMLLAPLLGIGIATAASLLARRAASSAPPPAPT